MRTESERVSGAARRLMRDSARTPSSPQFRERSVSHYRGNGGQKPERERIECYRFVDGLTIRRPLLLHRRLGNGDSSIVDSTKAAARIVRAGVTAATEHTGPFGVDHARCDSPLALAQLNMWNRLDSAEDRNFRSLFQMRTYNPQFHPTHSL